MTKYGIDVQATVPLPASVRRQLERAAIATLEQGGVAEASELTLVLTDENEIRRLNREYRAIDRVTDVLSFEMNEPLPEGGHYLGDVVIAVPVAEEQARARGHELSAELLLLVIHGVLHLLGEDHTDAQEKASMWAKQNQLLAQLGLDASPSES